MTMGSEEKVALVTRSQLISALRSLGVRPGQVVFMHASVKSVGWIVGGPDEIIAALLDVLTPDGTLGMYIAWEEWEQALVRYSDWSLEQQQIYRAACPTFDPCTSRANREWSILTEYLRTWPGAQRSDHPSASVCAVGAQAGWITADHPLAYGYGAGSPWDKLCQFGGKVLLLGSPLENVTLLHYAEHMAGIPNKNIAHNEAPMLIDGQRVWVEYDEFDTTWGIRDRESSEYFGEVMRSYLDDGHGNQGKVGQANAYLLDAADLAGYAMRWMERAWRG